MSWDEFNKHFNIQLRAISSYELKTNSKCEKLVPYFIGIVENKSFEIWERETRETVEMLNPVYKEEDRIYEIQDLFNIRNDNIIKAEKEKIFREYTNKELKVNI